MFWYVFILHLCNHSCTTNKESLNNQCGLIDSAALCNITLPSNIISPQCNYIHSRLTLSLNAAACSFFGCKNLTFYCWVVKKYFLFYGLHKWLQCINTHIPSSVQHAAQSDLFFFSSSLRSHPFHWLDGQITPDRPELFMRRCECLCGTLYKRAGTHRTLFSTSGCPLFAQTAEGLHGAGGPPAVDEGTSGSQLDAHQLHEDLLTSNCEADMFYLKADDAVETPTINGL